MRIKYFLGLGVLLGGMVLVAGRALAQNVEVDITAAGYEVSIQDETELGLTREQSGQLAELGQGFLADQAALRDQIRTKRAALRLALSIEDIDRDKLQSLSNDILAIQGKLVEHRIDHIFKVREVLTPAQWQKLHALRSALQAKQDAQAEARNKDIPVKIKVKKPATDPVTGDAFPTP